MPQPRPLDGGAWPDRAASGLSTRRRRDSAATSLATRPGGRQAHFPAAGAVRLRCPEVSFLQAGLEEPSGVLCPWSIRCRSRLGLTSPIPRPTVKTKFRLVIHERPPPRSAMRTPSAPSRRYRRPHFAGALPHGGSADDRAPFGQRCALGLDRAAHRRRARFKRASHPIRPS